MPPQDDDLLRDAAEDHLVAAEAKVEAAVDTAVGTWLETVRFLILQAATEVAPNFTLAVDAWRGAEQVWLDQVDTVIIPAIAEAYRGEPLPVIADGVVKIGDEYGEQFRAAQRADEFGAYRAQGEYMRTVRDRFKIWPEGAFEDVRPELMESASEAESIEQVIDRVGRVLDIDKNSRTIKAEINVVEKRLMDDDLDPAIRKALAKQRRELWKAHDAEVSSWKWKARRIARTECLPADTPVSGANITAVYRRHYEGKWIKVKTRSGREISGTPNHPVLTVGGWKGLGQLTEADHLVCYSPSVEQAGSSRDEYIHDGPTTIGQIFDAAAAVVVPEREGSSETDFHGDGREGYVDVLRPHSLLRVGEFTALTEGSFNSNLSESDFRQVLGSAESRTFSSDLPVAYGMSSFQVSEWDSGLNEPALDDAIVDPERSGDLTLGNAGHVSVDDRLGVKVETTAGRSEPGGFTSGSAVNSSGSEYVVDGVAVAADGMGDSGGPETGFVELDDVVMVQVGTFSGHVYNLTCIEGYFSGPQGIVTSNTHGAVNAGQIAAARRRAAETGERLHKRWLGTKDDRTRASHRLADGQIVELDEKFQIDSYQLDFPGDPVGPGHVSINCRCSMRIEDEVTLQEQLQGPDGSMGEIRPGGVRLGPDDPYEVREALQRKQLVDGPGDVLAEYLALGGDRYLAEWGEVIVDDSERMARVADQLDDENRKFWQSIAERASLDLDEVIAIIAAARVYKRDRIGRFASTNSGGTTVSVDNGPLATSEHVEEQERMEPPEFDVLPKIDDGRDIGNLDELRARMDENVTNTNPRWEEGHQYQVNCQRCVQALELRDRGHDVTAAPMYEARHSPRDKWSSVVLDSQMDLQLLSNPEPNPIMRAMRAKKATRGLTEDVRLVHINMLWREKDGRPSKFTNSGTKEKTLADLEQQPPGSRGWVTNAWRDGGAHVWSWQVVDEPGSGTRLRFVDPQKKSLSVAHYLDESAQGSLSWIRVNDLVPQPDVLDMVE